MIPPAWLTVGISNEKKKISSYLGHQNESSLNFKFIRIFQFKFTDATN